MTNNTLKRAAELLRGDAEAFRQIYTIDGDWGDERGAKRDHDERLALSAELERMAQVEPVAWRVHPFDYGVGHDGVYALTMREDQVSMWSRKGWNVGLLYAAPPEPVNQQLLAALKEARETLQFETDSPGGAITDTIFMMHRQGTVFDLIDSAIAVAEDVQGQKGVSV